MRLCYACAGEGVELLEAGFWEAQCSVCGGTGTLDDDPGDDDEWGEYFDHLHPNEPDRYALLFDAGTVPVMYEPQPDRQEV